MNHKEVKCMDIKIIASTKVGEIAEKDAFDIYGGKTAGICYVKGTFDELMSEDIDKTRRRISRTKEGGHHSVYEHNTFSLYLDGVPKIVAMMLNGEKQYSTSEKSARYTTMVLSQKEGVLYKKWVEIFKNKITKLYAQDYPNYFTDSRIEKLALENARLLTSVFTPCSLVYTTNYRQFNILISLLGKFASKEDKTPFEAKLTPYVEELVTKFKELPYYDAALGRNEKCRSISLFHDDKALEEYYGDVYASSYKASFACFAQLIRHRTINYSMKVIEGEYYVPEIIKDSESFTELWLSDMKEVAGEYPQGMMLEVYEMGTLDDFLLKLKERKCTCAQLEAMRTCNDILKKYEYALRMKIHPRAEEIIKYTKGSRCTFPDYTCPARCGFPLGVDETRKI